MLKDQKHGGRSTHAVVVCGYSRNHPEGSPDRISLLVQDDQRGPYLWVHNIAEHVDGSATFSWDEIIAPLPDGLWLSGESAERWGGDWLIDAANGAVNPIHEGIPIEEAQRLLDRRDSGDLTLRTYAIASNRFKRRFAKNSKDNRAIEEYMFLALPRYIWVVEAISRKLRSTNSAAVIGEVIFDATSDDERPTVLAIRLPGVLSIPRRDRDAWEGRVLANPSFSCGRRPVDLRDD